MSVVSDSVSVDLQALPTDADILAQLDRIQSSTEFAVPERARMFLTYVVGEAIAGRSHRIKAYSIAIEVFARDSSFDPQMDPVVRIQAGLIRRGLEHYYLVAGQNDPVVISMPKGGYVPVFSWPNRKTLAAGHSAVVCTNEPYSFFKRTSPSCWFAPCLVAFIGLAAFAVSFMLDRSERYDVSRSEIKRTGPDIPKLVVEPFEDLSGTHSAAVIAQGLTDEVIGQLAKFKEIMVVVGRPLDVSSISSPTGDPEAPFLLEGRVRVDGDKFRLSARLVNGIDGSIVWTNNYDNSIKVPDLLQIQTDIARSVATFLSQPHGTVF